MSDYSATWWRGKVELKGDKIHPLERKPYNPFTEYFPYQESNTRRTRSLYHRFVDVDPTNPEAVTQFCQNYGVFGKAEMTWEQWNARGTFPPDIIRVQTYKDELSHRMDTKSRHRPHESLCVSMTLHEFQLESSAMKNALKTVHAVEHAKSPKERSNARDYLSERIAGELTKLGQRPIWNKKEKRWTIHWDSLSLVALMYQMLLLDLVGPGRNIFCEKCGKPFLAEHPRARFCSRTCWNTAKVARGRANRRKAQKLMKRRVREKEGE